MKKFLKNFSLLGVLMLVACVLLGVGDVSGAVFANGTATEIDSSNELKGSVVNHGNDGALEQSDIRKLRPEMIDDPVDQNLVKIRPSVNQLDTILRYAGSMKTNNFEYEWYSIGTREVFDKVKTAADAVTGIADIESVKGEVYITGNINKFDVTDTIIFPTINGADNSPLVGYVYEKDADKQLLKFTVAEDQITTTTNTSGIITYGLPAIPVSQTIGGVNVDTEVYCLGRAAAELDVKTPAISFIPKPSRGYCQIFMCQVAQSTYERLMDKKIKFDISEIEEQALYEYRKRMEGSFLFGHKGKVYDPNKMDYIYMTDGITRQIKNKYTLDTTATDSDAALVALEKQIFTGNSGSKERVLFAGSKFIEKVSCIRTVKKQLEAGNTEVIWGIKWNRIESNFGTLLLSHHEILDEYGWSDKGIVIDPQYLKKWQISNFERKEYDGKELAIMNGKFTVFTEVCGVAVYNPDAHAIIELS